MDRKGLFSIGEVSKLFHISVSSLRHYEKVAILLMDGNALFLLFLATECGSKYTGCRSFKQG